MKVQTQVFLTSVLGGGDESASRSGPVVTDTHKIWDSVRPRRQQENAKYKN
jgi:hypothetical protein